jgi:hypothetical protein
MISTRLIATLLGCAVIARSQCVVGNTTITAKVVEGEQFCRVVHIPQDWQHLERGGLVGNEGVYRRSPNGDGFLFTLSDWPPDLHARITPAQKYWIDLSDRGKIRLASEVEWSAATEIDRMETLGPRLPVVLEGPEPGDERHIIRKDDRVAIYKGRAYQKSGDIWMGLVLSPSAQFIAARSFNGWWHDGKAPFSGPIFIDVYDFEIAKKLAFIKGDWCDWTPNAALDEWRWISDRDAVFPFGDLKRDIIVCRFKK